MKAKLVLISLLAASALAAAHKPISSATSAIWYLVSGTITADAAPDSETALALNANGAARFQVMTNGAVFISPNALSYWGGLYDASLVLYQDTDAGDADWFNVFFGAGGLNGEQHSQSRIQAYGSKSFAAFRVARDDTGNVVGIDTGSPQMQAVSDGAQSMLFDHGAYWVSDSIATGGDPGDPFGPNPVVRWKLGSVIPATVQLVTDRYVQVEIGGVVVKLAVVE